MGALHDHAAGAAGDLGQLRLALGGERRREWLALVVDAVAVSFTGFVHVWDWLRRASTDLHHVNGDVSCLGALGRGHGIALKILAVRYEQHHATVSFRLGIAIQ